MSEVIIQYILFILRAFIAILGLLNYICNSPHENYYATMVNSPEFAKRLQKILEYYGLSATSFSEKIDFNRSTISHLLSGRNKPSLEFVMKVLQQFPEVQLYWLLNGTGNFPSTPSEKSIESSAKILSTPESEIKNESYETIIGNSVAESASNSESKNSTEIERIIIFYKDGSFKAYQ